MLCITVVSDCNLPILNLQAYDLCKISVNIIIFIFRTQPTPMFRLPYDDDEKKDDDDEGPLWKKKKTE